MSSASIRVGRGGAGVVAGAIVLGGTALVGGCAKTECATPDYSQAECRVIAENELARLVTSRGAVVRFVDPDDPDAPGWTAAGHLLERADGTIDARIAGLAEFAIAISRDEAGPSQVQLALSNLSPDATIEVGALGDEATRLPTGSPGVTHRTVGVSLPDTQTAYVRGTVECPERYRIAVVSDVQTGHTQFERVVTRLQQEAERAREEEEPLVGLIMPGDISENSRDAELALVTELLGRLPFPVALTPGNHDIYRTAFPYFTRAFGPGNHAFSVCRTRVAMLDTGNGSLADSVEARLPQLLDGRDQDHLLVAMHHPPYAGWTGSGWSREDQAAHLLTEAALAGVDLVLAGHAHALHEFEDIPVGDTTLREIISGTAGALQGTGPPRFGYVRLTFGPDADDEIEACFVEVPPVGAQPDDDGLPMDACNP